MNANKNNIYICIFLFCFLRALMPAPPQMPPWAAAYIFVYCTADCGDALLDMIFEKVFQDPAPYVNEVLKLIIPEDLSDHTDRQLNSHSPPQRDPAPAYKASVGYIG